MNWLILFQSWLHLGLYNSKIMNPKAYVSSHLQEPYESERKCAKTGAPAYMLHNYITCKVLPLVGARGEAAGYGEQRT